MIHKDENETPKKEPKTEPTQPNWKRRKRQQINVQHNLRNELFSLICGARSMDSRFSLSFTKVFQMS